MVSKWSGKSVFLISAQYVVLIAQQCVNLGVPGVTVVKDGHHVSRRADYIVYSVEAEYIEAVVKQYGPCTFQLHYTPGLR